MSEINYDLLEQIDGEISKVEDELLLSAMRHISRAELETAEMRVSGGDDVYEDVFINYIIYDYELKPGKRLIDTMYDSNELSAFKDNIISAVRSSYISVFEVIDAEKGSVSDIFSRDEFNVSTLKSLSNGNIIIGRVYDFGFRFIKSSATILGSEYKGIIYGGTYTKLKEYEKERKEKGDYGLVDLVEFVRRNPEIIHRFSIIIEATNENVLWDDEELDAHVAKYVFEDRKEVLKAFLLSNRVSVLDDEDGETVLSFHTEAGLILCEVVVLDSIMELEGRTKPELAAARKEIEDLLGKLVHFSGEEVIGIESLI